jgi:DNA-binding IclR family transcriptional regulator
MEPLAGGNRPVVSVRALERALSILDAFTPQQKHLSLPELVSATGLPKATVYRLASTLVARGYLERLRDGYGVGIRCFALGTVFRDGMDLRIRALPYMIALRDQVGETTQLAILAGESVVYIEEVFGTKPLAYWRSRAGVVLPAYCTALGKALLAFQPSAVVEEYLSTVALEPFTTLTITSAERMREELELTKRRGFAVDDQEREYGYRFIAAPAFDNAGLVAAAVTVTVPVDRLSLPIESSPMVPFVLRAAEEFSRSLGFPNPYPGSAR